jgi:hypothetical protein
MDPTKHQAYTAVRLFLLDMPSISDLWTTTRRPTTRHTMYHDLKHYPIPCSDYVRLTRHVGEAVSKACG